MPAANPAPATLARGVAMFVLDVDGVMTDGKIILDGDGQESKNFYVRDGLGIAEAVKAGYKVVIISGRHSPVVEHRARELRIHEVRQGVGDKLGIFEQILEKHSLNASQAAFMGDDVNDLAVLKAAGFSAAPADADETVRAEADWVSRHNGGAGAVREMIEFIMKTQHKWPYTAND
ncbi:MAG: HAD-IIIA family hydrolase [Nitrospinae bacterium]|nr:HAD-IIIA family hydrolase [Nitrospinota bacterium]